MIAPFEQVQRARKTKSQFFRGSDYLNKECGSMDNMPRQSLRRKIRVKKEDSAFVYFILESYEGMTSYSTLDFKQGDSYRDLELRFSPDFANELDNLLKQFGDLVYEIKSDPGV